jgi:hypothetical protein
MGYCSDFMGSPSAQRVGVGMLWLRKIGGPFDPTKLRIQVKVAEIPVRGRVLVCLIYPDSTSG